VQEECQKALLLAPHARRVTGRPLQAGKETIGCAAKVGHCGPPANERPADRPGSEGTRRHRRHPFCTRSARSL